MQYIPYVKVATTWGKTLFGSSLSSNIFLHIICIHVDVLIAILRYNGYVRLCNLRFMRVVTNFLFFPWVKSILVDCVCVHHFLYHSSINGQLDYFHVLATVT